jgi:hypothetical protein
MTAGSPLGRTKTWLCQLCLHSQALLSRIMSCGDFKLTVSLPCSVSGRKDKGTAVLGEGRRHDLEVAKWRLGQHTQTHTHVDLHTSVLAHSCTPMSVQGYRHRGRHAISLHTCRNCTRGRGCAPVLHLLSLQGHRELLGGGRVRTQPPDLPPGTQHSSGLLPREHNYHLLSLPI